MARFISTTNCYIERDGKYLMFHRSKDKEKFPDCWMGPGGKQEPEESVIETCIREVKEETGLDIKNPDLKIVATTYYPHKEKVYTVFIFTAKYQSGKVKEIDDGELAWVDKEKIIKLENLHPDLKWHIPILLQSREDIIFTHTEYDERGEALKHRLIGGEL